MASRKEVMATAGILGIGFLLYYLARQQSPQDSGLSFVANIGAKIGGNKMLLSPEGKAALQQREGSVQQVYTDAGGRLTVGIGHLLPAISTYKAGDPVTVAQVETWFLDDIQHAENLVNYFVRVPLTHNQFDALASAAFNLGDHLFKNTDGTKTHLLIALEAGNYQLAANDLLSFDHVNGQVNIALANRRGAEAQQFLA